MAPPALRLALVAALAFGCAARTPAPAPPPAVPSAPPPARLVLSVVLDQVGSWVLERHLPLLREDGLLKTTMRRGLWARRVAYTYAGTYTGPGHAAIYTGAPPADSGIVANRRWDRARAEMVGVLDDGHTVEFGGEAGSFVSPSALRAETVADVLRRAAAGRSGQTRVVSLSMKDRGAVIPGGQRPDVAAWYTESARGLTTSAHYGAEVPAWLRAFNAEHPVEAYFGRPWEPLDRAALVGTGVTDDAPGEGDWHGLGVTFPHLLSRSRRPLTTFLATPFSTEYLVDAATAATRALSLGADAAPDLLMLSVSGTDYVGHVFGPESWEAVDNLVRVDATLGAFVRTLEAQTTVAVLITADHGVMPLVERERAAGNAGAARIEFEDVVRAAEEAVDAALGPGDWVAEYVQPYLYLRPAALAPTVRERALTAAAEGLRRLAGVGAVHRCDEAVGWRDDADPVRRAVARSVDPRVAGELFLVPADGAVVDERMPVHHGTSHGSPWARDTEVPVLVSGPGVAHGEIAVRQEFPRTAATLSALLGVDPPAHARGGDLLDPALRR